MKRFSHLVIASAVLAALTAPVLAQQSSTTDPTRGTAPRDGTGMPSGSPTDPQQHPRPVVTPGGPNSIDRTGSPSTTDPNSSGTQSDRRLPANRGADVSGAPGSDPGTTGGPAGATGSGAGTTPGAASGGTTGGSSSGTPSSSTGPISPNPSSAGRTTGMPSSDPGAAQPGGGMRRPGG